MDELAERVLRRFEAMRQEPTANAKAWAAKYEAALKSNGAGHVDVKLVYGGNVRTTIQTMLDGKQVPDIVIDEERKGTNYFRIKWVRVDSGPNAKFINDPGKMAKYVVETY